MIIGSGINFGGGITISNDNPSLYPFTTFTFTTGNTFGRTGPTLSTLTTWYQTNYSGNTWITNTSYYNQVTQGYQRWTVPATGLYSIQVSGARASRDTVGQSYMSGNGAIISGTVNLTQGHIIEIICGQYLDTSVVSYASYAGLGGGGGTFVNDATSSTLLMAAGGGGGAGTYSGSTPTGYIGQNAVTGTWAGNGLVAGSNVGGNNGFGGNVYTGLGSSYRGGAGAGWLSNGQNGDATTPPVYPTATTYGFGGNTYVNGFTGGSYGNSWGNPSTYAATYGGFGGGGGSNGIISGGGGGGYSGGGISSNQSTYVAEAGGGGSYIISSATGISTSDGNFNGISTFNGSSIVNLASFNVGPGTVVVTKLF